ncbi:MAG: proline dehydrogenase family protein, partial [Hyphomonadaceae bacterium]
MTAHLNWDALDAIKYRAEEESLAALLAAAALDAAARASIVAEARALVAKARAQTRRKGVMESFLEEFGLSNAEGLALMCLAEALLRVPDEGTADRLIAEKIASGRWEEHLGRADHWLVNAATWGLMLTGRLIQPPAAMARDPGAFMSALAQRVGEPAARAGAMQAMRILGEQFVLGRTIEAALKRGVRLARAGEASGFSFDMLGEGARTEGDARAYCDAYAEAIAAVGGARGHLDAGVSVKLSALHPRYEARQEARVTHELYPRLYALAEQAAGLDVPLCLDAEEADRLTLSLKLFSRLAEEPALKEWSGLGLAVQAYQKRARGVIAGLERLARARGAAIKVRLVKGAYWDGEIKRAQQQGRPDYPVFTTKAASDLSYLVCARDLIAAGGALFAQFATHNAHSAAAVRRMAEGADFKDFEFQRLHGMGGALYAAMAPRRRDGAAIPVRVYAPVGGHEALLPYLVRRLLENGANTSFVHAFLDDEVAPDIVAADPIAAVEAHPRRHRRLPAPPALYGASRKNAAGRDLSIARAREALAAARAPAPPPPAPRPAAEQITRALAAQPAWNGRGGAARARALRAMSDALEANLDALTALLAREAKRTLQDGIDVVREAGEFCRYYAAEAERLFGAPQKLPGPAGEANTLELHGRGVFICISPW